MPFEFPRGVSRDVAIARCLRWFDDIQAIRLSELETSLTLAIDEHDYDVDDVLEVLDSARKQTITGRTESQQCLRRAIESAGAMTGGTSDAGYAGSDVPPYTH